jgi:diguanylate cyclase (GGDEF)-like protein
LNLDVEMDRDGAESVPLRCVDFCEGGLFLQPGADPGDLPVLDGRPVTAGERVWISFESDTSHGRQSLRLSVRIARVLEGGLGVSFDPPDISSIVALQRMTQEQEQTGDGPDAARLAVLDGVHMRLSRWLRSTLERAVKSACAELFVQARDATNNLLQTEYMDAMRDLERVGDGVSKSCRIAILRGLERLSSPSRRLQEEDAGASDPTLDSSGLALVDTGSFDDWVTAKNIMSRAEPGLRDAIYELSRRLSELSGRTVDDFTNPAGLQQIGMAFNESLQNLGLNKPARKAIYKAFDEVIVASLGGLYEQLNEFLVEQGVLPTVTRPAATPRDPSQPDQAEAAQPSPQEKGETPAEVLEPPGAPVHEEGSAPARVVPPSGGYAGPGAVPQAAEPAAPSRGGSWADYHAGPAAAEATAPVSAAPSRAPGPAPDPAPAVVAPSPPPNTAPMPLAGGTMAAYPGHALADPAHADPAQAAPVPLGAAYRAARSIMNLRRGAAAGAGARGAAPVGAASQLPQPPSAALQLALNAAQRSSDFNQPAAGSSLRLKDRLRGALARDGVSLSPAQEEVMDVLSTLMEALLGDPMVTNEVKPRLKRLAVPMLKVAMKEQEFFTDESHPARQVVNRLGMLELPEELGPGGDGYSLREHVDPLLDRIIADDSTASREFMRALPQLDGMLQHQGERFSAQVRDLVGSADHARAVAAAATVPVADGPAVAPWVARTAHLRAGDVLRFGEPGGEGHARPLAWVSDDHSLFVFTDRDGSNGTSMDRAQLARAMASGHAALVDAPQMPTMDRGVVSMLDRMHAGMSQERDRDRVTGLMSTQHFVGVVETALERSREDGARHALLALDVDGFDVVQERGGRKAAESLLRKLSRLFGGQVGAHGALTRRDEHEFLLLLADHAFMDAKRFAKRQCRAVANSRVALKGEQFTITLSVGMAPVTRAVRSAGQAVAHARAALATARRGGNQVKIFDPDEDVAPTENDELNLTATVSAVPKAAPARGRGGDDASDAGIDDGGSAELLQLLDGGDIILTRQLVQPLGEGEQSPHYEVLLGTPGEEGERATGSIPPHLIPAAEAADCMGDVDRWVIRNVLGWMQRNRRALLRSGGYAINLSGNTLSDPTLLDFVMHEFTESAVPPAKVIFEVTESVAIDRLSNAVDFIRTMREYGCRFSIDDFGAGHATFTYLKTLPVDFVKIDGLFVREMASDSNGQAMVRSIHEISHLLGKKTVAEHVESDQALALLKEMGVDYAQGYAVSRPERLD